MKYSRTRFPARYPPIGAWPTQMRADMAAAYLDYRDTAELAAAIGRRDAPPPSCIRGKGRHTEPVWSRDDLDRYVAPRVLRRQNSEQPKEDLQSLV